MNNDDDDMTVAISKQEMANRNGQDNWLWRSVPISGAYVKACGKLTLKEMFLNYQLIQV